jgi:hypothetical protein
MPPQQRYEVQQQQNMSHGKGMMEREQGVESEGGGIWDTAKQWALAAGQKASQAEEEIWRMINKN